MERKKDSCDWSRRGVESHAVEALVKLGAELRAFVRYNSRGDIGLLKSTEQHVQSAIEIVAGDLRDSNAVLNATESREYVFHIGALIGIPYSYTHPREVTDTNVMGTFNVRMACRQHDVSRLIRTSTSEVYGSTQCVPIIEDHPLQGQSPYVSSKIGADKLVENFFRYFALNVRTIRPFNTYRPRQSDCAVVPTIISQASAGNKVKLGALWPRPDSTLVRDTVEGFIKAAESNCSIGLEVNVGFNKDIGIGDLTEKNHGLLGKDAPIIEASSRLRPDMSEVKHLRADYTYAQQTFDWKPVTDLDQGLEGVIPWVKDHPELYQRVYIKCDHPH